MRYLSLLLAPFLFSPLCFAIPGATSASVIGDATPAPPAATSAVPSVLVSGTVADPTGAIVPGALVQLKDASGATAVSIATDGAGNFAIRAPHSGDYTLSVSRDGFQGATQSIHIGKTAATPLQITLAIANAVTDVTVTASSNSDIASTDANSDSTTLTADDLKKLPIFDNDYVTAMSAFMDQGAVGSDGAGLLVDGVESNRVTVSPSAVQEVHINQDPYSAQYYRPGRGQMEIITKPTADAYHGEFNFFFRDSALNAQNAFAPSKPFEQRRVYEGFLTGPVAHSKTTSFLFSLNRQEEDANAVVNATVLPTVDNPTGEYRANVPVPNRNTEFSMRVGHQFSERSNFYAQYSYQDTNNKNQNVGGQTLPEAAVNTEYREDDLILHEDFIVSPQILSQFSLVIEHNWYTAADVNEGPKTKVPGNFTGGSAQGDQHSSENSAHLNEIVSWTHGRHSFKFGANMPELGRRVFEDNTNSSGTYTFATLNEYSAQSPSTVSISQGQVRFLYHQQVVGGFIQDQIKVSPKFSLTPGLRYDWQNFLGSNKNNFAPRLSFAYVLHEKSQTVLRGGGGVYYDRYGSGPLLDMARYETAKRQILLVTSQQQQLCVPINSCADLTAQPASYVELQPGISAPYQVHYGLSLERQVGEHGTATISGYSNHGFNLFRSVDVNAPLGPGYSVRPDPTRARVRQIQAAGTQIGNALDVSYRGRYNKYFSAFGHYTWSHYGNNTSGIGWYPQDQRHPDDEWANSDWDQRQRFGLYAMFNSESLLNLAVGIFASTGHPYTIQSATDTYGDNLFNARPEGVPRNSEISPDYADLDLRWAHDFKLNPSDSDKSPVIGFSASAFNVLNHVNGSSVDNVEGTTDFGQIIAANPPRRIQLAMRFTF